MSRAPIRAIVRPAALGVAASLLGCPAAAPPPGPSTTSAPPPAVAVPAPPPPPAGDCRRAHALATRAERLADASERVHVLQQAVQLCDAEGPLWRDLGLAYRDSGDRDGARRALERARSIDPGDPVTGDALDSLPR